MVNVENISKSYKDKLVCNCINLRVKKGEIKALIGANGSGKSTLIELILGIRNIDKGKVVIGKLDVADKKNREKLNRFIGYVPQTFSLFNDLTVYENLGYICSIYGVDFKRINNILEICYLKEYKNVLAQNLSGGYKQLLALASVLIHNPKLIILDEPTSAMDPIFRKKFWEILKKYNASGVTIFLITHFIEELLECDSFACLSNGEIKFDGKVDEFKSDGFINIEQILNKYN